MMRLRCASLIIILIFCSNCSSRKKREKKSIDAEFAEMEALPKKNGMWDVWGIENGEITFNNQKKVKTGLSKVKVLATPKAHDGTRYILVSGKECNGQRDCEGYINVYLHRMKDDPAQSFTGGGSPLPGKLSDFTTQNIIQHYRVFWGDCLANQEAMVIWIGWTMTQSKKRVKVAAYYKLDGQPPDFQSFDTPLPKMSDIQPQIDGGTCHSVPEQDQDTPS